MNLYFSIRKPALRIMSVLLSALLFFSQSVTCQNIDKNNSVDLRSAGELKFGEISINSPRIGLYEKFEMSFNLEGEWENPFDPDQIKVDARFYTPDGKQVIVPGFFYKEYRQNSYSSIEPIGQPVRKIRFSPNFKGEYKAEIIVISKGKEIVSQQLSFTGVSYNTNHGFLKISKSNSLYFEFDDGTPFFAVAVDNAVSNYFNYMRLYPRFAGSGGNYGIPKEAASQKSFRITEDGKVVPNEYPEV